MKTKKLLILSSIILLLSGCTNNKNSSNGSGNSSNNNGNNGGSNNNNNQPTKVVVAAHTLDDGTPPIDIDADGQPITKSAWNTFKNSGSSVFNSNYNYTYRAYTNGSITIEQFTRNGYYAYSPSGSIWYERKSGSTFYVYTSVSDGYLRSETTLDLQNKYTTRLADEVYVHMFNFDDYEYNDAFGAYIYSYDTFSSTLIFHNGYLTYLYYHIGSTISFEITATFETTIEIPKSYYYEQK